MKRLLALSVGKLAALFTFLAVLAVLAAQGPRMFSPGPLSETNRRGSVRCDVSTHAQIASCSACHVSPWSSDTMADRCLVCHADVLEQIETGQALHGRLADSRNCRACHTEHRGAHATLTNLKHFDHECARFKLTGKHAAVACASCHVNDLYKDTPQACSSCHTEPGSHKARGFDSNCNKCHSTDTWDLAGVAGGTFDHARTGFPLTGRHHTVACASCHAGGVFAGTPQTCAFCHKEPVSHKPRGFGDHCGKCHSTDTWGLAGLAGGHFDHHRTGFPLTGKHRTVACASCHIGGVFAGTSQSCVSCHAEPVSHKGRYGTNCVHCHNTAGWAGATFKHTFPIDHRGAMKKGGCASCHKDSADFRAYTCYGCHEHEPKRMARRHERLKVADLNKCADCHMKRPRKSKVAFWDEQEGDLCPVGGEGCVGLAAVHRETLREEVCDRAWPVVLHLPAPAARDVAREGTAPPDGASRRMGDLADLLRPLWRRPAALETIVPSFLPADVAAKETSQNKGLRGLPFQMVP